MIILKIKNNVGPGNQMFMYARAYTYAKKYQHKILILSEISGYSVRQNILQYLNLDKKYVKGFFKLDWTKNQYIYRLFRKIIFDVILKLPCFHQMVNPANRSRIKENEIILKKYHCYVIDGYWECHEYFDEYRDDLINQYQPNYSLKQEVIDMIDKIKDCQSISVHIRKGDFKEFGRLISDDYYEKSMNEMMGKIENTHFFILTEDESVKKRYEGKKNITLIDFHTQHKYIDEWYVLTKCKYHIIANSTYSWWSSYLSDDKNAIIIIPSVESYLKVEKNNNEQMYKNYYCIKSK